KRATNHGSPPAQCLDVPTVPRTPETCEERAVSRSTWRRAALQWSPDRLRRCQLFTAASGPVLLRLVRGGRSSWPRRVPDAVFTLPASQDPLLCVSPEIGATYSTWTVMPPVCPAGLSFCPAPPPASVG